MISTEGNSNRKVKISNPPVESIDPNKSNHTISCNGETISEKATGVYETPKDNTQAESKRTPSDQEGQTREESPNLDNPVTNPEMGYLIEDENGKSKRQP